jgi:DNA end-binding protein Ku
LADEEEEYEQPGGLRPIWSGSITFGLVSVPVSIYSATRPRGVSLRMIGPVEATVQRRYVCSKDGKVLDADDIVRGYEIEKDKFVVITDDELEAIEPKKSREIDLRVFVDVDGIDPIYFEKAYFLVPSSGTNKAYRLLADVMEKKKQAGVATFVMRDKEYLVAILAENGILRAETLRFADEIRKPGEIGLPKDATVPPAAVKKFEAQIGRHAKRLDLHEFLDDYTERLEKLVASKEKKKEDVVRAPEEEREESAGGGEVVDLLEVLSRSLGGGKRASSRSSSAKARSAKRAPARRAPRRRTTARRATRSRRS